MPPARPLKDVYCKGPGRRAVATQDEAGIRLTDASDLAKFLLGGDF